MGNGFSIPNLGPRMYCALLQITPGDDPTVLAVLRNDFNIPLVWDYLSAGRFSITAGSAVFTERLAALFTIGAFDGSSGFIPSYMYINDQTIRVTICDENGAETEPLISSSFYAQIMDFGLASDI